MHELVPVLGALSPGSSADIWVAESLAKDVLAPKREERDPDWDWRLQTFELIPPAIRDQSKAILHHWARSLYRSADQRLPRLALDQRLKRFGSAVEKLERATGLPRRPGRDEHPSHLYNTLGTAYSRYSLALQEADRAADRAAAWTSAYACTVRKPGFGYAAWEYSLISPLRTRLRRTRTAARSVTGAGDTSRAGGRCSRP
jgi:hypothetical protein